MTDDARHALEGVLRLAREGRLDDALARCDAALTDMPDDVNLVAVKGAVLMQMNDLDGAETWLRRAISTEPSFLGPREDLGALLLAKKEPEEAIVQLRKALALDPGRASIVTRLAGALDRVGREDEADDVRLAFAERTPAGTLLAEAEALCRGGEIAEAEKLCDALLRRDPRNTGALKLLAMAANEEERFVIAEAFLTRIVRLSPEDPGALQDLAAFLNERGRYPEAIEHLTRAADRDPSNADIQLMLGNLYSMTGKATKAMAAYDRCLAVAADNPSALVGRGHLERIAGREDAAMAAYRRALELRPDFGAAWWYLSSLHGFVADDDDIATMKTVLGDHDLATDAEVGLHFALARAFEKREDFESAWHHYEAGNTAKRALVSYDPVKSEVDQRKIRAAYTAERLSVTASTVPDVTPIFIVGMPRSGSTLIEQVLASHSQVEGSGELPYIVMMTANLVTTVPGTLHYTELLPGMTAGDFSRLGANYLDGAASYRVEGKPYFTDKMPANYAHAGFIRQILPQAKIIDARRDPMATCVANYRQLFAQGKNQSYDLVELGEYYVEYVKTMAHWDAVMPGAVLRVQYEDVVDDLESQVRRILDHCGLPFESDCLEYHRSARPVNTASAEQVRRPIYRSAVAFWRHYDAHLDALREVLAPVL